MCRSNHHLMRPEDAHSELGGVLHRRVLPGPHVFRIGITGRQRKPDEFGGDQIPGRGHNPEGWARGRDDTEINPPGRSKFCCQGEPAWMKPDSKPLPGMRKPGEGQHGAESRCRIAA